MFIISLLQCNYIVFPGNKAYYVIYVGQAMSKISTVFTSPFSEKDVVTDRF